MAIPPNWMARLRFTAGVLLVWATATVLWSLVTTVFKPNGLTSRLPGSQLCVVNDFMAPNMYAPTPCLVFDREYQIKPTFNSADHLERAEVDRETLMMVDYDSNEPDILKGELGRIDVDKRLVAVWFISGPLSGRRGFVARYKIETRKALR